MFSGNGGFSTLAGVFDVLFPSRGVGCEFRASVDVIRVVGTRRGGASRVLFVVVIVDADVLIVVHVDAAVVDSCCCRCFIFVITIVIAIAIGTVSYTHLTLPTIYSV